MSDEGHHYSWGAPKGGWPAFNNEGKRLNTEEDPEPITNTEGRPDTKELQNASVQGK